MATNSEIVNQDLSAQQQVSADSNKQKIMSASASFVSVGGEDSDHSEGIEEVDPENDIDREGRQSGASSPRAQQEKAGSDSEDSSFELVARPDDEEQKVRIEVLVTNPPQSPSLILQKPRSDSESSIVVVESEHDPEQRLKVEVNNSPPLSSQGHQKSRSASENSIEVIGNGDERKVEAEVHSDSEDSDHFIKVRTSAEKTEFKLLKEKNLSLQTLSDDKERQVQSLQGQLSTTQKAIGDLRLESEKLKTELAELKSLRDENSSLQKLSAAAALQLQSLQSGLSQTQLELIQTQRKMQSLGTENQTLKEENKVKDESLRSRETQYQQLVAIHNNLQQTVQAQASTPAQVHVQIAPALIPVLATPTPAPTLTAAVTSGQGLIVSTQTVVTIAATVVLTNSQVVPQVQVNANTPQAQIAATPTPANVQLPPIPIQASLTQSQSNAITQVHQNSPQTQIPTQIPIVPTQAPQVQTPAQPPAANTQQHHATPMAHSHTNVPQTHVPSNHRPSTNLVQSLTVVIQQIRQTHIQSIKPVPPPVVAPAAPVRKATAPVTHVYKNNRGTPIVVTHASWRAKAYTGMR